MKPNRNPADFKLLHVARVQDITPHFRRVILTGDDDADFSTNSRGDHIKLLIPDVRERLIEHIDERPSPQSVQRIKNIITQRATRRIYTIADYDASRRELSVDFVLHGDNGPASAWASHAAVGDAIGIIAPRGRERFVLSADWFLLMSDLSGLAALNAVLHLLPDNAIGHALIEVESDADIHPLQAPQGIKIQWLVRHQKRAAQSRLLIDTLRSIEWHTGKPSITLAAENEQVILIRKYLRAEKNLSHDRMYAIPYWKESANEDQYHTQRHEAMADAG